MAPLPSLAELIAKAQELGARLNLPVGAFDHLGVRNDFAQPFIVVDEHYHYVVCERGTEFERRSTLERDEILYWIFEGVTFDLASRYELAHRVSGQDFRRLLFARQLDAMETLNPAWRVRLAAKLNDVLANAPFTDSGSSTVT